MDKYESAEKMNRDNKRTRTRKNEIQNRNSGEEGY